MDVTHVLSFEHMQYVHVTVDTYSHLIFASAHTGENLRDVRSHCFQAFAWNIEVPKNCKNDKWPAYNSTANFC